MEIASLQHPGHGVHVESLDEHPEDHGEEEEMDDGRHHLTQHLQILGGVDIHVLLGKDQKFQRKLAININSVL